MLSYIEDHEVGEAHRFVEEGLGFPLPSLDGDSIAVKLFIRPEEIFTVKNAEGKDVSFYLPESVRCIDKFRNCTALVIAIGAACEKDLSYRIGDFIVIPRNEGTQFSYYGIVLHILPAKKTYAVVRSPETITKQ